MTIVYARGGMPYSSDFLSQLSDDLLTLSDDMNRAGCASARVAAIRKAAQIARTVRDENRSGDD